MNAFIWVALVFSSLLVGACVVGALVSRRGAEVGVGVVGFASLAVAGWAFGRVIEYHSRFDAALYAMGLSLGAFIGGYALASALLDRLAGARRTRLVSRELQPQQDQVAVALFACTESESYSPRETADEIAALSDDGLLQAGLGVMPFLYTAQKARYRAAGGHSPALRQLRQVAEGLEQRFLSSGRKIRAVAASCAGDASLSSTVRRLAEEGFGTIVVAPYAVSDSLSMDGAMREVDALRLAEAGVSITVAEPLWSSEDVAEMVAARVLAAAGTRGHVGAVLVGHGQPELRELRKPDFDQNEVAFLNRVRNHLADGGLSSEWVKLAWSEWRDPDVTSAVRHLAALGATRILVAPAVYTVESIDTMLDLPMSVRQARIDPTVSVVILPAWRDDPVAIAALNDAVDAAIDVAAK